MKKIHSQPLRLVLALLAIVNSCMAHAGAFSVTPIRLNLSNQQKVDSLVVTNTNNEEIAIQAEIWQWSQDESGKDVLTLSRDVLVSPTMFKLNSKDKQTVRLGLRQASKFTQEQSYRLILRELPPPPKDNFMGVGMLLKVSVPVFVQSTEQIVSFKNLEWQIVKKADFFEIELNNIATNHLQILGAKLYTDQQNFITDIPLSGYVLPNKKKIWKFSAPNLEIMQPLILKVETDQGDLQIETIVK